MKRVNVWAPWVALFGVLVGAGVASGLRPVPAAVPAAAPATIGVVRLTALITGLTESKERAASLEARRLAVLADLRSMESELQGMQEQISSGALRGEQLLNLMQEYSERQAIGQARLQAVQTRLDIARGDHMREMYDKVRAAVAEFAAANGYDLIIVDDRSFPMPRPQSSTEVQQEAIQARRVMYAREGMDVTEQVLTLMNNRYAAGGGGRP